MRGTEPEAALFVGVSFRSRIACKKNGDSACAVVGVVDRRQIVLIVGSVAERRHSDLPQVSRAGDLFCFFAGLVQRRQQHSCQNCNDCNCYQELYECESVAFSLEM